MKKERKQHQRKPAKPTAEHPKVLAIEQHVRDWFFVQKRFVDEGPEGALRAIGSLMDGQPDPSDSSAMATASVQLLDSGMFDHDATQEGRSRGGNQRGRERKDTAASDYTEIQRKATLLLDSGKSPRDVVGIIKEQMSHSRMKIYRALQTHPAGHWKKKQ